MYSFGYGNYLSEQHDVTRHSVSRTEHYICPELNVDVALLREFSSIELFVKVIWRGGGSQNLNSNSVMSKDK
jgi:hypothetical protein